MYGYREIEDIENFRTLVAQENIIEHCAFQNIDFSLETVECCFKDCLFFGCTVPDSMQHMLSQECYQYPKIDKPYNIFPSHLYSAAELYAGYDPHNPSTYNNCYDCRIYNHYIAEGKRARDISETFARAMHDHSISDALHDLLSHYNERQVVSVMGGHALLRTDTVYRKVVLIAKHLTSAGCIIVTGGGPGAMEAAHLGAWLAGYPDEVVDEALAMLATAPCYKDEGWLPTAFALMERYPSSSGYSSVGVPTWFYGHEPTTPFATHIAKYFDNSIREDGILEIAKGGVIYSPGSAGTMQEIFQDAAQNHYQTYGYASPMVFIGTEYWNETLPVYPLLSSLLEKGRYRNLLLSVTDSIDEAERVILDFIKSGNGIY
ncbi:MAG: hypothetical protein IKD40_08620 [Bacteroidaceae bacterium]|nr:hypothetical protein [Bacteroidaceae bacterium]